jgi:hypothetical protein
MAAVMHKLLDQSLADLEKNDLIQLEDGIPLLTKVFVDREWGKAGFTRTQILSNIQAHPTDPKYRSIKKSSKALQHKVRAATNAATLADGIRLWQILTLAGAHDLLYALGFRSCF